VPDEVKAARGTLQPCRSRPTAQPGDALVRWPAAPRGFKAGERAAWKELGKALLPMRTIGTSDLMFVARAAKMTAKLDAAYDDPEVTPTTLSQYISLFIRFTNSLGINPAARRAVSPLTAAKTDDSPDDEFT
jgi:hypothetical protein